MGVNSASSGGLYYNQKYSCMKTAARTSVLMSHGLANWHNRLGGHSS